jgi:predicted house-cleaning noncanonical NTP pyrophosphatase (MazG superfamily)
MKKVYNKLIRDNIPEIIKKDGKECNIRVLNDEEYFIELNKKLDEEIKEYKEEYSIEELADVQEIINAIVRTKGYSLESFNKIRIDKKRKNGGFVQKLFLISVEDNK